MNKIIYLLRHGETVWNKKGVFRGRSDIPLNETGLKQAEMLGKALRGSGIERIYSSPLKRAVQTSNMVAKYTNGRVIIDVGFQNIDIGKWQGMQKNEVKKNYPKEWQMWLHSPEDLTLPGGESVRNVQKRTMKRIEELIKDDSIKIFAISSHRSVLKTIVGGILKMEGSYFWKTRMDNCSINTFEYYDNRGFMLTKLNDTHHLKNVLIENE